MIFILFSYLISSLLLQNGFTALIWASWNGHLNVVRTLLDSGGDINAKDNVSNQMMMIILLTIFLMLLMMMMMKIVMNEDRGVCR